MKQTLWAAVLKARICDQKDADQNTRKHGRHKRLGFISGDQDPLHVRSPLSDLAIALARSSAINAAATNHTGWGQSTRRARHGGGRAEPGRGARSRIQTATLGFRRDPCPAWEAILCVAVVLVLILLPLGGALLGHGLGGASGAGIGAVASLLLALLLGGAPTLLFLGAEKRKYDREGGGRS